MLTRGLCVRWFRDRDARADGVKTRAGASRTIRSESAPAQGSARSRSSIALTRYRRSGVTIERAPSTGDGRPPGNRSECRHGRRRRTMPAASRARMLASSSRWDERRSASARSTRARQRVSSGRFPRHTGRSVESSRNLAGGRVVQIVRGSPRRGACSDHRSSCETSRGHRHRGTRCDDSKCRHDGCIDRGTRTPARRPRRVSLRTRANAFGGACRARE